MIKIRLYKHTDRYYFENLIKEKYLEYKNTPPDSQKIIDSIGFFSSFPQAGRIFIITYNNNPIGYSIVQNQWKIKYGGLVLKIDELYINKNFKKFKPELNFIEFLLKEEKIYAIEVKLENFKTISKRILNLLKFDKDYNNLYVKVLSF